MTSYATIFNAFLSKITDDEWADWTTTEEKQMKEADLLEIMELSIPWFKFPRVSLRERVSEPQAGFSEDLSYEEINIIATYMKCEWLDRTILSWENIRPLYDERDFSQANLIDKFCKLLEQTRASAADLERTYYRSIKGKPFDFTSLANNG